MEFEMEEEKDLTNCLSFLGHISGVEITLKERDDELKFAVVTVTGHAHFVAEGYDISNIETVT